MTELILLKIFAGFVLCYFGWYCKEVIALKKQIAAVSTKQYDDIHNLEIRLGLLELDVNNLRKKKD